MMGTILGNMRQLRTRKGLKRNSMGSRAHEEEKTGSGPCLVLKDLSIDFGGLRAVDGVNLTIEQGERRVLMGPNGAGKTTLFNLISGIYPPSRGRIYYFGKEITCARSSAPKVASLWNRIPSTWCWAVRPG